MTKDELSLTFLALADPTRRSILKALEDGERTVSELTEPFDVTMPAITKHLKVLEQASLVERSRDAQCRPSRLNTDRLKLVSDSIRHFGDFR